MRAGPRLSLLVVNDRNLDIRDQYWTSRWHGLSAGGNGSPSSSIHAAAPVPARTTASPMTISTNALPIASMCVADAIIEVTVAEEWHLGLPRLRHPDETGCLTGALRHRRSQVRKSLSPQAMPPVGSAPAPSMT